MLLSNSKVTLFPQKCFKWYSHINYYIYRFMQMITNPLFWDDWALCTIHFGFNYDKFENSWHLVLVITIIDKYVPSGLILSYESEKLSLVQATSNRNLLKSFYLFACVCLPKKKKMDLYDYPKPLHL